MSEAEVNIPKELWLTNPVDPRRNQRYSYGSRPRVDVAKIPGHARTMNSFRDQQRTFYGNPGTPVMDWLRDVRSLFRRK